MLYEADRLVVSVVSFWEIGIKQRSSGFKDLHFRENWFEDF